jgi:hypothetical protein
MARRANATLRTAWAQAFLDTLGAAHLVRFYDGTQPTSTSAAHTGTLLGTLTADATPGSVAASALTFDTANYTQSNGSHVNGTPTYISFVTSGGARVYEVGTADGFTFTGVIQNGVDIARDVWTWTAPDA